MFLNILGFQFQPVVWKKQLPNCLAACSVRVCKVLQSASEYRWDKKTCECFLSSFPSFSSSLAGKWGCRGVLWVFNFVDRSGRGELCSQVLAASRGSPLSPSPDTDHVCGKLVLLCSCAGLFSLIITDFRWVLKLFMGLVDGVLIQFTQELPPKERKREQDCTLW